MSRRRREWQELLLRLGGAFVEVLEAELAALGHDFARTGKGLLVVGGLLGLAAGVVFWFLGVLVAFGVALLALWMPVWGAALTVAGLLLLAAAIAAALAWARFRRLESPLATVERRWDDHLRWWQERVLEEPGAASHSAPRRGAARGGESLPPGDGGD